MKNSNSIVLSGLASGTITGGAIDASQIYQASFQVVTADTTAAGTVKIQMSNDLNKSGTQQNSFVPTNWIDVPSATSVVTAGVAANPIYIIDKPSRYLRVVFTRTAGAAVVLQVQMFTINV